MTIASIDRAVLGPCEAGNVFLESALPSRADSINIELNFGELTKKRRLMELFAIGGCREVRDTECGSFGRHDLHPELPKV